MVEGEKCERETGKNQQRHRSKHWNTNIHLDFIYMPSTAPPFNNMQYVLNCTSKTNWYIYIYKKEHTKSNLQSKSTPLHFYFCCGTIHHKPLPPSPTYT